MLYTFFDPLFSNIQPTIWFTTFTARIIITIICFLVSSISILAIIFKKYSTVDALQDHRNKVEIDKISDFIFDYLSQYHTASDKDSINEWVTKNFKK